ncbi:MAG: PIN domain nuclease [Gammaproteobacteria bacterium HGW-Gammaproteobacteria-8]|nr:MAG: PIN domain nuclease [Gammaproteobacteria bacterium HGW-Gammaproteobacteria-8]
MSASFVDTNILIYAHDTDAGDRHWRAKEIVRNLWETRQGMLSTQVLHEFYINVTQKIPSPMDAARARAVIEPYLRWRVQTLEPGSVLLASEIQQRYRISFWDALIVLAASKCGAAVLYTEDLNPGQVIEGVRIVNPLIDPAVHDAGWTGGAAGVQT